MVFLELLQKMFLDNISGEQQRSQKYSNDSCYGSAFHFHMMMIFSLKFKLRCSRANFRFLVSCSTRFNAVYILDIFYVLYESWTPKNSNFPPHTLQSWRKRSFKNLSKCENSKKKLEAPTFTLFPLLFLLSVPCTHYTWHTYLPNANKNIHFTLFFNIDFHLKISSFTLLRHPRKYVNKIT